MTLALLIICSVLTLSCWLTAKTKVIHCELFELTDKGGSKGLRITKCKRRVHLRLELLLFLLCRLPKTWFRKAKRIFSSSIRCCYKMPSCSGAVGGKIPVRLYAGSSAQIKISFPWERPLQGEADECGSVSSFLYSSASSSLCMEIELEAAGLHVADRLQQRHELNTLPAMYLWDIFGERPGVFTLKIIARLQNATGGEPSCSVAAHKIRVVQVPCLSRRHVWMLTAAFAICAASCGLLALF